MVITIEASKALAVVRPFRLHSRSAFYVCHRAYASTCSTTDAFLLVHPERLVGDEPFNEGGAEHITVDARPVSLVSLGDSALTAHDVLNVVLKHFL
jgi:hypothetical protein